MIEKMFNDSIRNGKFNPAAMVRNFDYIFEKNPDFAKALKKHEDGLDALEKEIKSVIKQKGLKP